MGHRLRHAGHRRHPNVARRASAASGTSQFIGDYSFSADGTCFVARPYSGEVVAVNDRLKIQKVAKLGRQPFEAIELSNGGVIARDWKTGDLLTGRFESYSWLKGLFK